jgi:hypothetical protein
MKFTNAAALALLLTVLILSCSNPPSGRDGWLKGAPHEKLDVVARQLRGWDMTMVETGYRYQELYWAGMDGNWEYATYQAEKIRQTMEYGLERRPKRKTSAETFLKALQEMDSVVTHHDTTAFLPAFQMLTRQCNTCHKDEKVPFFRVDLPLTRQSPIRGVPPN